MKEPLAYRLEPLHNLFVPDDDMIQLIGRTSLPSGVRSRVRGPDLGGRQRLGVSLTDVAPSRPARLPPSGEWRTAFPRPGRRP